MRVSDVIRRPFGRGAGRRAARRRSSVTRRVGRERSRCSRRGSSRARASRRASGNRSPSVRDAARPGRRPGAASRATPGAPSSSARSRTTVTCGVADPGLDAHVGEAGATRAAARWRGSGRAGRRGRRRPRSRARAARRARRASASSRSVASLSAGWRSTVGAGGDRGVERRPGRRSRGRRRRGRRATPSALRVLEARVGGDHEIGRGQVARARSRVGGSPPANTSAVRARRPMVPSAGITRIRFEGSATHDGRPLSPAVPSSPGIQLSASHALRRCAGASMPE